MKRLILAAIAALTILSGCEYHPFYDGQEFCIFNGECGLLKTDGGHAYVPFADERPYILDFYGGMGKSHTIAISDPDILGYEYIESDVKNTIGDSEILTAGITLIPKKIGDTSITVTDDDTRESIQIFIHVCEAYKAIEVYEAGSVFEKGTVFAFRYPYDGNVLSIGRGSVSSNDVEFLSEGKFSFFEKGEHLFFEIEYPTLENGKKTYLVFPAQGYYYGAYSVMRMLNLVDYELPTRAVEDVQQNYNVRFVFMEYDDPSVPVQDSLEGEHFIAYSARIISRR